MAAEFLMLAETYESHKYGIGNWFMSEKCDGMRAFWDGGYTRGLYADQVSFANTEKDGRYINRLKATGLWSRYGKPIQAPDWWLDNLPRVMLDGELWMSNRNHQLLMSTVKQLTPGPDWGGVKYMVFDAPHPSQVFAPRTIKNTMFKKKIENMPSTAGHAPLGDFERVQKWMADNLEQNTVFKILAQDQLHWSTKEAEAFMLHTLERVTEDGGEGLMLRQPSSLWTPTRSKQLLKVKKLQDAEGIVIGYTWGRETDKGSKLLGLMGALVLDYKGKRFELSGFTEEEREMCLYEGFGEARSIGLLHPGEQCDNRVHNPLFPLGTKVTFRYRELTRDGIPKEARYLRRRID